MLLSSAGHALNASCQGCCQFQAPFGSHRPSAGLRTARRAVEYDAAQPVRGGRRCTTWDEQASDEEVDDLRRQGEHHGSSRPAANGHAVAATAAAPHSRQHPAQRELSHPTSPEGWDRAGTHGDSSHHSDQADTHRLAADVRAAPTTCSPSPSDHRPPTVSATAWNGQSHRHSSDSSVANVWSAGGPAESAPADLAVVKPADLFPSSHVQRWSPLLAAYFPFGCAVAAMRMAMWVVLLAVDSPLLTDNDSMIKVLYGVLGIRVRWRGAQHLPDGRHVVVSNHVTVGDLMVLYSRPRPYVHLITSRLPRRITQAQHHRVKLRHASGETYCSLADSAAHPDSVHLFPEGGMTNGRGMMKFSRGFMRFGRGLPIVPAAMRAENPFGISTHTLSSSFLGNMFWFCFAPWVALDITVLPPMEPAKGEGNGKFVERVQEAIAAELSIPVSNLTLMQKHKLH